MNIITGQVFTDHGYHVRPSILTSHYLEAKESLSPLFNLIAIAVSHISWFNLGIPNILESCHLEMKPNSQTWS